ncbi:MAG: MATE family efflux transporter [Candidatus Hodarchaeales archaeon]|jgi:O-antigen/teichoic acid export membrane protein
MIRRLQRFTDDLNSPANFAKTMITTLILLKAIGFVFNKIFFTFLDQTEFGIYTFISTSIITLAAITAIGIPSYILRYCTEIGVRLNKDRNGEIFFTGLFLNFLADLFTITFLLIGVLLFELEFWGGLDWFFLIVIGLLNIFQKFKSITTTYSTTNHHFISYFLLKTSPTFFLIILGIFFGIILDLRVFGLVLALFLSEMVLGIASLGKMLQVANLRKPNLKTIKSILNYSAPIYLMGVAFSLFNFSLYYLTGLTWGPGELTLFVAAFSVANLVGIFSPLFQTGYKSVVYTLYERKSYQKISSFTNQSLKLTVMIFLPIYTTIYFLSPELIALFSIEAYSISYQVIPFLLANNFIQSIYPLLCPGSTLRKKTKILAVLNILGIIIAVVGAFILIPIFGYIGMGMSFLLQNLVNLVIQIPLSQYYYRLHLNVKSIFILMVEFVFSCSISIILIFWISLDRFISLIIFLAIYGLLIIVTRQVSEEDKLFVKKILLFRNN